LDQKENSFFVEPNITEHSEFDLTNYDKAIKEADIIVYLVAHKEFKNMSPNGNKETLDFCGVINHV
jgi:UDP-N-acetyl-D-mannosaminuronic acid dehydrogenase